ncbi:MAG: DUF3168 domain-containing protein [Pseudomonadota bacterium]
MTSPVEALRTAVRSQLLADAHVMQIVTGVYETAPSDAIYPYITFGNDRLRDWSAKTFLGQEHDVILNCWSTSHNFAELYAAHDRIKPLLRASNLTLQDHHLAVLTIQEERFILDRDRNRRLGVLRCRALTHADDITPA